MVASDGCISFTLFCTIFCTVEHSSCFHVCSLLFNIMLWQTFPEAHCCMSRCGLEAVDSYHQVIPQKHCISTASALVGHPLLVNCSLSSPFFFPLLPTSICVAFLESVEICFFEWGTSQTSKTIFVVLKIKVTWLIVNLQIEKSYFRAHLILPLSNQNQQQRKMGWLLSHHPSTLCPCYLPTLLRARETEDKLWGGQDAPSHLVSLKTVIKQWYLPTFYKQK